MLPLGAGDNNMANHYDYYTADQKYLTEYSHALNDIVQGATLWRSWLRLGWRDFVHQTRRTILGPLWSVVGLLMTIAVLGIVYGSLFSWPPEQRYPYMAAGMTAWFFISGCIQGGNSMFISAAGLLTERSLPLSFSMFRYTTRLFIEFIVKFSVFIIFALIVSFNPGITALYVIPGLILYYLNGLWVNLLFGTLGAGYRDIGELLSPIMLMAFLVTPILWPQTALGDQSLIALANPFTHFIAVIRDPLLGQIPSSLSLSIVVGFLVAGWTLTLFVFAYCKNRIVFWL